MKTTETNEKTKPNKKKKKKSTASSVIATIILVIAVCVFIFAGYKLITIGINYGTASSTYNEIQEIVQPQSAPAPTTAPDEEITYDPNDIDPDFVWDYPALLKLNSDSIGWIKMRGEGDFLVNYPVVQCDNNDYYLDHLFDRTENPSGAIFMNKNAKKRFEEPYTYLYGHNMAQGSRMFGYLKQYDTPGFIKDHTLMDIYTPDKHYVYKVFATYIESETGLTYTSPAQFIDEKWTDQDKEKEIKALAKYALDKAQYETDVKLEDFNKDTHILTLSTCYGGYSDPRRYIIMMIRLREVPLEPNLPVKETQETTSY